MTEGCRTPEATRSRLPRLGHSGRLRSGTRTFTMLLLGHFLVFVLAMSHDEIALQAVESGWIRPGQAELAELGMGLVLFMIWGWLSVRVAGLLQEARAASDGKAER